MSQAGAQPRRYGGSGEDMAQALRVLVAGAPAMRRALEDVAENGKTAAVRRSATGALATAAGKPRPTAQFAQVTRTAPGRLKGPGTA